MSQYTQSSPYDNKIICPWRRDFAELQDKNLDLQEQGLSYHFHVSAKRGLGFVAGVTTFPVESYMITPEKSGSWHFPPMIIFFFQRVPSPLQALGSTSPNW